MNKYLLKKLIRFASKAIQNNNGQLLTDFLIYIHLSSNQLLRRFNPLFKKHQNHVIVSL